MSDVTSRATRKTPTTDPRQMSLLPVMEARRNRVVEAGAGTGKTTSIVKSVVELLLDNPMLAADRIVLVTFTDKAAGEIADRIRHALVDLDAALAGPGEAQWPANGTPIIRIAPEKRESARDTVAGHLRQIDLLRSQTIHSFCQSILRLYPIEAGLDPQFALVQGFERLRLYDRIYREWFESETRTDGRAEWIAQWATAFAHLGALSNVRSRIFSLADRRDLIETRGLSLGDARDFERTVVPLLEAIRSTPDSDVERLSDSIRPAVEAIRSAPLPVGKSIPEWLTWFEPVEKPLARVNLRNKKPLSEDAATALETLRGKKSGHAVVVDRLRKHLASAALLELTRRFIRFRDEEKDRRGVVDFDDLLFRVRRLLDNPEVLNALRRRYEYLFVDEFQDTDRVQAEIINRLARDASGAFVGGKTVLVGDAKQSIYGFRRADPETYAATVDAFIAGGAQRETLDVQYRSSAELVGGLNTMFSRLFSQPGTRSVARPAYTPLEAGKKDAEERDARFTFLHVDCGDDGNAQVAEARAIVSWIRKRDPEGTDLRRFALLFRARTHWQAYLDTFDRCGLPYVVQPIAAFLETPAAVDLLTVLRAAALPFDEAAFVSAARSRYFGLSDSEIVRDKLGITDGSLVKGVRERLASWTAIAERSGAAAAVDAAVEDSGMELVCRALRPTESRQTLSQIARFRRMAVDWDLAAGGSLRQFVEEIARRQAEGDDKEPPLVDDNLNAVRIMTAHGAKGLEFGTVILPAMTGGGGGGLEVFAVDAAEHTLVMRGEQLETLSATCCTADGVPLAEIGTRREAAEDDRLFYVAVTRAITEVVFVCDPEKLRNSGFWKSLNSILGIEKDTIAGKAPAPEGRVVQNLPVGEAALTFGFERVVPAELADAPERFATPAVAPLIDKPYALELESEPSHFQPLSRAEVRRAMAAEGNRAAGILLHRVLEIWDLEPKTLQRAIAAAVAELGSDLADVVRVRRRLMRLDESPVLARVRAARCAGRELSIYVPGLDGSIAEKRIDRLVAENGGYLVVDYKSGSSTEERTEKDRAQVEAYCEAIARISGSTCRGLLWYIDDDEDRWIEV
ncbi:MAG: UvrD-helicase domain-containing protein [Thermoanaerobaculia bacterium]